MAMSLNLKRQVWVPTGVLASALGIHDLRLLYIKRTIVIAVLNIDNLLKYTKTWAISLPSGFRVPRFYPLQRTIPDFLFTNPQRKFAQRRFFCDVSMRATQSSGSPAWPRSKDSLLITVADLTQDSIVPCLNSPASSRPFDMAMRPSVGPTGDTCSFSRTQRYSTLLSLLHHHV